MPSFFVDRRAQPDGAHMVHARDACPPASFPRPHDAQYLGELLDAQQALVLARVIYARVAGCIRCAARGAEEAQASTASYVSSAMARPILHRHGSPRHLAGRSPGSG
jgi:hypothetical protein